MISFHNVIKSVCGSDQSVQWAKTKKTITKEDLLGLLEYVFYRQDYVGVFLFLFSWTSSTYAHTICYFIFLWFLTKI